jgi:hypothetical protein
MTYAATVSGGDVSTFDARKSNAEWNTMLAPYQGYLTTSSVRDDIYKKLHVENSTKTQIFTPKSKAVSDGLATDSVLDYTQWYDWLQANGYATLLFVGEWDMRDGPASAEPWLKSSQYLNTHFWEDSRRIYFINDTQTGQRIIGGYWRSDPQNLITLMTLPKAGHSALRDAVPILS